MPGTAPVDRLGRPLQTLRISITDRCNLRCRYCMPAEVFGRDFAFLPRQEILSFEELTRVASAFVDLGVRQIRVTGGEPLLRKDVAVFIGQLRAIGKDIDIALTTNGSGLDRLAEPLCKAGLDRINISLDALDSETASSMAGRPVDPDRAWQNILLARDTGLSVKVNCVIKRGLNDREIIPLAQRCRAAGITLRFIEFMDVGNSNDWRHADVVTGREVLEILSKQWELVPAEGQLPNETARRYRYTDGAGEVGFINSISEPFCRGCNRARLSADGTFYTCLFASTGQPVKRWLREERLDQLALAERLAACWGKREDRYSELRGQLATVPQRPEMWTVGG